jgi:hypothetical protein
MHAFGGAREAAGIGNGDEGLQLVEIKGRLHRHTYQKD